MQVNNSNEIVVYNIFSWDHFGLWEKLTCSLVINNYHNRTSDLNMLETENTPDHRAELESILIFICKVLSNYQQST